MALKNFLLAASLLADPLFVAAQSPSAAARPDLVVLILGGALPDMPNRSTEIEYRQKMVDQTVAYLREHSDAAIEVLASPDEGVTPEELAAQLQKTADRHARHVLLISLFDAEAATTRDGQISRTENRLLLHNRTTFSARDYYGLVVRHLTPGGLDDPELSILDYSCQGFANSDALTLTTATRAAVFSTASKVTSKDVNMLFKPPLADSHPLTAAELVTAALLAANADKPDENGKKRSPSHNIPRLICMRPEPSDTLVRPFDKAHRFHNAGHKAGLVDPDRQLAALQNADHATVADAYTGATAKFLTDGERKAALKQLYKLKSGDELRALAPEMTDRIRAIGFAYGEAHPETQQSLLNVQVKDKLQRVAAPAPR